MNLYETKTTTRKSSITVKFFRWKLRFPALSDGKSRLGNDNWQLIFDSKNFLRLSDRIMPPEVKFFFLEKPG